MAEEKKKTGSKLQKSYFDVLGICCSSEVGLIENILKPLDGIKEISVIVPTRTVIVLHDSIIISQIQIAKALNQARLEANVRVYGEEDYKKKWPSPYAIASGSLLSLSLLKYVYHPLQWLALGAVALGIIPIALKAIASIRNFRLDINILIIIAVIGTIAMNDYLEAGTIVFLFTIAEWLEARASHKAKAVMSSLVNIAPQNAVIAETGELVDAGEVKINTIIAVKAGEIIPIDGIVAAGKCDVDEKNLTGESFPVAKQKDSSVWAGTINLNGYVSVKTTAVAEDCVVAKMAKLVEEAQNNKSNTQKFIDKCTKFYTPAVIVVSASLALIPAALQVNNTNHWFHLALVVLVSACPCALILSTPVATFCALTKAAKSGLLIKGGDFLETLAKVKVIAFDKTGTITRGEFVVTDCQVLQFDIDVNMFVYWVTSIESKSSHPLAAALIDYGRLQSIDCKPENVEKFENFPGEGVYGKIDGKEFYVGSRKIATRAGCPTVPSREHVTEGKTIGYVFCEGKLLGKFSLSDKCRSGVEEAITEIKSLGIKTAMLTGDSTGAAMHVQQQLRSVLEEVHGELLPEEKAKMIRRFKKEGPTAMVGDGINDAPALATADIGISMGISGSALANETGNVILMSNDVRKVGKAIKIARKCRRKVVENVVLSFVTKAAILGLGFAGHPLIWAAVLADVGTCLMVTLNSMLLLKGVDGSSGHHHHHHHHKGNSHCCSKKASVIEQCTGSDEGNHCHGKSQKMNKNGGLECGGAVSSGQHDHHHKGNSHCCSKKASAVSVQKCAGFAEENHCHGKAHKIDMNGGFEGCRDENGGTPDGKRRCCGDKDEFEKSSHRNCCSKRASQLCAEKSEVGEGKHCHGALKMDNNGGLELVRETNGEHPGGIIRCCVQKDAIQTNGSHCCSKRASDPQECGGNGEGKHRNGRADKMENNGGLRSCKLENGKNPVEKKGCCVEKEGFKRNYDNPSDSSSEDCCRGENSNEILHTAIDMEKLVEREREKYERESEGSSASIDPCSKSCEKRGMGGCCKSYMKECGQKHASFVHGLSEIITE